MTGVLASVNSIEEARLILPTSVDIIDLKQPERGALGALSIDAVKAIVNEVNHKKPVSATVGDLPMQAKLVFDAVKVMTETGVDYIKIGFFPGGDWQGTLSRLADITLQRHKLIAVLFADTAFDFSIIESLRQAGFYGVMLDTMDKSKGSLPYVMTESEIKNFVSITKSAQLLCGLAGSLKQHDIAGLLKLNVDYLGFRGALCKEHNRTAELDLDSITSVLSYF